MYPKAKLMHLPGKSQFRSDDRWVVVHDAERDHYELPVALAEVGALERFVTDWYTGLDRPFWQHLANTRLGKSTFGISKRYRLELPSRLTIDNKLSFCRWINPP